MAPRKWVDRTSKEGLSAVREDAVKASHFRSDLRKRSAQLALCPLPAQWDSYQKWRQKS
jgi:hypothetical protein